MTCNHQKAYCFLILLIIFFVFDTSFASNYMIKFGKETYNCYNFYVKGNEIYCSHDKAMYVYKKEELKEILYNYIKIYPYVYDENKILNSIKAKNCSDIIRYLYGPLYIDKIVRTNMFLGLMYDKGVCLNQDYEKALLYYKKSNFEDSAIINYRIKEINRMFLEIEKAKLEEADRLRKEEIQRKEKIRQKKLEEQRQREIEEKEHRQKILLLKLEVEKYRPECEKDCAVNKYQYDTSCFKACMHYKGLWWYGTGVLDE